MTILIKMGKKKDYAKIEKRVNILYGNLSEKEWESLSKMLKPKFAEDLNRGKEQQKRLVEITYVNTP